MAEEEIPVARLERELGEIRKRLDRLEAATAGRGRRPLDSAPAANETDLLTLSGTVHQGSRSFNFRHRGRLTEALGADAEAVAAIFAGLGNPFRVKVLRLLLDGPLTSHDLQAKLEVGAPGQLYHHLKELMVAGLISQEKRGVYAIREEAALPVLIAFVMAPRIGSQRGIAELVGDRKREVNG